MTHYTSCPGLFGQTNYYDESGNQVGSTWDSVMDGTRNHYDASGERVGSSTLGLFTRENHYLNGEYAGETHEGLFGESRFSFGGETGTSWDMPGWGLIDFDS